MQNAQNADLQRVINLVELYRTKVGKESDIAKEAKDDYDFWEKENLRIAEEDFANGKAFSGGVYAEGPQTEAWIKHLMVNEQLLGHFYAIVAGKDADKKVLEQLLPELYDTTVFTLEEESFLIAHFREMVNYIIQTPCNELKYVHRYDNKDKALIPNEVLSLIRSRVNLPVGTVVYNPFAGFGQFANCFRDCYFYCEESYSAFVQEWNDFCDKCYKLSKQLLDKGGVYEQWAWLKVALFANNPNAKIIEDSCAPSTYDAMMAFIPIMPKSLLDSTIDNYEKQPTAPTLISKIRNGYKNLRDGGDMILLVPNKALWDAEVEKPFDSFWEELVANHAIVEIIQLPSVMSENLLGDCCIIIAKKGNEGQLTTMIDARFATVETSPEKRQILDIDAIDEMLTNGGKDIDTGLKKLAQVPSTELNADLLFPQVYVVERPSKEEKPTPLSALCSFESTMVCDVQFELPEDTPWITMRNLTPLFTGDMNLSDIKIADCPNNPPFVEGSKDYAFDKNGKFIDDIWAQMGKSKGQHVLEYRHCTFLDGNTDAVLYERSDKHGERVAIVRAMGKPYVVSKGILVFCPKNGFDAYSLAALLRLPIVYRQIAAYEKYGIETHLDDILAPTDKRVIGDELSCMKKEESVTNELEDMVQSMKTEYINEVRMRKHDMGQYIFELMNIEDLMRYHLDNRENEDDFCQQMEPLLDNFRTSLSELSTLLDNLSREEEFGNPRPIRLDNYLSTLTRHHKVDGYSIEYHIDRESLKKYDEKSGFSCASGEDDLFFFPTVNVAPEDILRMGNNILDNAKKHGFTEAKRDDYTIRIDVSIDVDKNMFIMDFRNNGNPLPEGMNKMRYGIKGEKAGKFAGTGIGGNYIKRFVEHYGGNYDIFMDNGWTVIRICLPII